MSAKEGVSRIAKTLSLISWLVVLGCLLIAAGAIINSSSNGWVSIGAMVIAVTVWLVFQAIVWIVDGFAGNRGAESSLFWPLKRKPKASNNPAPVRSDYIRHDLKGIGGWLMFFIISLMVLSPLKMIGETMNDMNGAETLYPALLSMSSWGQFKIATWIVTLLTSAAFFYSGLKMWRHYTMSSVVLAIRCMWLTPIVACVGSFYSAIHFLGVSLSDLIDAEFMAGLLGAFLYASLWTVYLKRSKRVRATYSDPSYSSMPQESKRSEPTL